MAKISLGAREVLLESVGELYQRVLASTYGEKFTREDYLDLFVPASLRPVFAEFCQWNGEAIIQHAFHFKFDNNEVGATLKPTPMPAWLVPKHAAIQHDARPDLVERVRSWVNRAIKIKQDWKQVNDAVKGLCDMELTLQQAAFCLPGLSVVAALDDNTKALDLSSSKAPRNVPSLPVELRVLCGAAARLIAVSQLVPEDWKPWDSPLTFSV